MKNYKSQDTVSIIIPAFNRLAESQRCIESCEEQTYPNVKIYFIDDGSSDNTSTDIPTLFPNVRYISGGDLWWTGSINLGIQHALRDGAEFVLLLNQDVVLKPNYIETLVESYYSFGDGLYGGLVLYMQDHQRIWASGGYMNPIKGTMYFNHGQNKNDVMFTKVYENVDWLPGMGTLVHKTTIQVIGELRNDILPHYFSDSEFCLRAKKRNIPVRVITTTSLLHNVGEYDATVRQRRLTLYDFLSQFTEKKSYKHWKSNYAFYISHYGVALGTVYWIPHMSFLFGLSVRDALVLEKRGE